MGSARSPDKAENWKKSFKNVLNSNRKHSQRGKEEYSNYLDADEDHLDGNEEMIEAIDRKNLHKMRYLAKENANLKSMLEDAEESVI